MLSKAAVQPVPVCGAGGLCGPWAHIQPAAPSPGCSGNCCSARAGGASLHWGPRHKEQRKDEDERIQEKMGSPLQAMSLGELPPRSLRFPKVCPSGLGQLVSGAASAVPWGPGQPDSHHHHPQPPTHPHTPPHRGCWSAGHRWRVGGAALCRWQGPAELDVQAKDTET